MEFVYQHVHQVIKEIYQQSQTQNPTPLPGDDMCHSAVAGVASVSEWAKDEIEYMVALLGYENMQSAMQLIDRGVTCLVSDTRSLFYIEESNSPGDNPCYCILPGRFCTRCSAMSHSDEGTYQMGGALPCIHITAVLLSVALSRYKCRELPPQELATALFCIMTPDP
ncbi:hypothetical protein IW150_003365 [Coemansia sp. RSA 2607]|nr:hypothetical protein IW150_003365 [Coemansia sp. RSA 2607]